MLKRTDLSQIRKVIREEMEIEVGSMKDELRAEMKLGRMEIQNDIRKLSDRIKNIEIIMKKIQKDVARAVNFLDKDNMETRKRVDRIEEHLGISVS